LSSPERTAAGLQRYPFSLSLAGGFTRVVSFIQTQKGKSP